MKKIKGILFLLILFSCGKADKLDVSDYIRFIENEKNGLIVVKNIADHEIRLTYQPSEYLALKEASSKEKILSPENFNTALSHYAGHYYFHMRIKSKTSRNNPLENQSQEYDEYSALFQYMSFEGQNNLKLISGKDTLECVNYHFENNFKLLPFNDIQMAFKKPEGSSADDLTLIWDDQVYGIGRVKIGFENNDINDIPQPIID